MEKVMRTYIEASDASFHLTRTSIYSFVNSNPWFTGTVYLLTHPELPLSNKNLNLLISIYPKIKMHSSPDHPILKIISKYRGKTQYLNLLQAALKWTIFSEDQEAALYFSNTCVFKKDSHFLCENHSAKIEEDTSLFYLDSVRDIPQTIYDSLNESQLTLTFLNGALNSYLNSECASNFYSDSQISFARKFPDSKFNLFKNALDHANIIVFDTLKTLVQYTKVNQIWLFKNKEGTRFLISPRNFKPVPTRNKKETIDTSKNQEHHLKIINSSTYQKKLAVFTTLNENYLKHAIVCFESFRELNPHLSLDFFVISKYLSSSSIDLLNRNSIKYINLDLSNVFKIEENWPYPSECFWLFKGPEIFNDLGYAHSLYVDADTQCNLPMSLNWLDSLELIAGADRGATLHEFITKVDNLKKIVSTFGLDLKRMKRTKSINSGVLFFNNKKYAESGIYQKAVDLFTESKRAGVPRKGDDSLLCLFMATYLNYSYTILSNSWNNYKFYNRKHGNSESIIIHHFRQKPWNQVCKKYLTNAFLKYSITRWYKTRDKLIYERKL